MSDHGTRELGRTLPATGFGPGGGAAPPSQPVTAPSATATATAAEPAIPRHSLSSDQERRFAIGALLGAGATSQVYALEDRDLARSVAVKLLSTPGAKPDPDEVERFIEEARITASLSHPNVLPVHDIDVDERGRVFFTMTRVDGSSLGALIERSSPGERSGPLADPNALVSIAIGVCQALAFAHRRGIVHQDIKPDNIMLGEFGEVLVVDWGAARRGVVDDETHLYGTPLYMSPEQARRERADARSDVYCIGATLFHALTLRLPLWRDEAPEFWQGKRAGDIDAPDAIERAASPAPLLAIALKALTADPSRRYADASAMLDDLRRYQAGLAVSALRESPWRAFRRWHARNGRTLWSWCGAAAVVLGLAGVLWGKHLEEIARWGRPVVTETFDDAGWSTRWTVMAGSFAVRDGRLVSTGKSQNIAMLDRRLRGAVAMEYEAEMLPAGPRCDISAVWARDLRLRDDGTRELADAYRFQVGAFDGAHCSITRANDASMQLAYSAAFKPEPGRRYRIRVEVDGSRLSLRVDGRLLCEWNDPIAFSGGFLGVYGHYEEKAFDDVHIYQREIPAKVSAIVIGDSAARAGLLEYAAAEYRQVAESHAGTRLGDEAMYKHGWSLWQLGRHDEAERAWVGLGSGPYALRPALHRAEAAAARGAHQAAIDAMAEVRRHGDADLRSEAAAAFARQLGERSTGRDLPAMQLYLAAYEQDFADARTIDAVVAAAYFRLGRCDSVLQRFPDLRYLCASSLNQLGRSDEVLQRYPDQLYQYNEALFWCGRFAEMDASLSPVLWSQVLIQTGRLDECVERYGRGLPEIASQALMHAGRFAEAEAMMPAAATWDRARLLAFSGRADEAAASPVERIRQSALIALGRWRELIGPDGRSLLGSDWVHYMAGIESWIAGDREAARAHFPEPSYPTRPDPRVYLLQCAAVPMLEGLASGDFTRFDAELAQAATAWRWNWHQAIGYDARFLLGRIDEREYLAQPASFFAASRLLLLRAMRHERHGRGVEALADWRAWLAVPAHRRGMEVDGALEALARWRIRELGG